MAPTDLTARWLADAAALAPLAGRTLHEQEGMLVLRAWAEPQRRYHTTQHLTEMLEALDELADALPLDLDDALLARTVAYYHDLVYDPRATGGSNEHRSATMARDHLHRLGVDDTVVDEVEAGVLMTLDHQPTGTAWIDAVHDADLWILAAPARRYAGYRRQVREEFAHVPDAAFATGRAAIIQGFLDRPGIYVTEHARTRWEPQARLNLAAELAHLTNPGTPA